MALACFCFVLCRACVQLGLKPLAVLQVLNKIQFKHLYLNYADFRMAIDRYCPYQDRLRGWQLLRHVMKERLVGRTAFSPLLCFRHRVTGMLVSGHCVSWAIVSIKGCASLVGSALAGTLVLYVQVRRLGSLIPFEELMFKHKWSPIDDDEYFEIDGAMDGTESGAASGPGASTGSRKGMGKLSRGMSMKIHAM